MIVKGKLIQCKREVKEYDKKRKSEEKLFITLAEVELNKSDLDELAEAFKDSGDKFTPDWIKNFEGYVNVSSKFELPFRTVDGEQFNSIEDSIANGFAWLGADVRLSLKLKDGAIYPYALVFDSEGQVFNAFAEFDED